MSVPQSIVMDMNINVMTQQIWCWLAKKWDTQYVVIALRNSK